jgi:hypothetical protein
MREASLCGALKPSSRGPRRVRLSGRCAFFMQGRIVLPEPRAAEAERRVPAPAK